MVLAYKHKHEALMNIKTTDVTDHQVKVNSDGTKTDIYFATNHEPTTGNTTYFKKIVDESKSSQEGYKPEVYFRNSPTEQWKQLPKGCPVPEIKPKEGLDKCEQGWKIGKAMATMATYMGMKKAQEDSLGDSSVPSTNSSYNQYRSERTKRAVEAASTRMANGLQDCLKRALTKTGFTVEKVCMHKGLVAESSSLVNSLKQYAGNPNYRCDYSALKEHGQCIPNVSVKVVQPTSKFSSQRGALQY